jgi:hypothetical protein
MTLKIDAKIPFAAVFLNVPMVRGARVRPVLDPIAARDIDGSFLALFRAEQDGFFSYDIIPPSVFVQLGYERNLPPLSADPAF